MIIFWLFACEEGTPESQELPVEDIQREALDLENSEDNTKAFIKMRGSLNESEDTVFYWHGYIYNQETADPMASPDTSYSSYPILAFEGFNIARFEKINDTEYQMLSREITVYKNLYGDIIDCFHTDSIGAEDGKWVPVVHVQNDPVNFVVGESYYKEIGDLIAWDMDIFLAYPSPLPVAEYPEYSASNTYQSVEIFDFYSTRADLEDPKQDSVPVHLTWVRHGQYLPWMQAGQKQGNLVYHAQGYKVTEGWEGLPTSLRQWTEENAPEYKEAPSSAISGPNITSWRHMKNLLDNGQYPASCQ